MNQDNLKELIKHPGWIDYSDLLEETGMLYLQQLFSMDLTNPNNIAKIIEIKAKMDCLKEMGYLIERQLVASEEVIMVDERFLGRLRAMLKNLWM